MVTLNESAKDMLDNNDIPATEELVSALVEGWKLSGWDEERVSAYVWSGPRNYGDAYAYGCWSENTWDILRAHGIEPDGGE